jgi:catechol 2,3-dioxygenase-like lactoylglutathione lyase family enzyme
MKMIPVLLWLALPTFSLGEASAAAPGTPALTATGAFLAFSVADVQESAKWYSEKLGLTVVMEAPKQDRATAIVLEGGGLIVELIQHDDAVPMNTAAPGAKSKVLVHGVVKAGAIVADFDQTLATLRQRNVPIAFGPFPARANQRANVIIQDNAGNLIQFFGR